MSAPHTKTLGASVVPALLGLSPWQTPIDAWLTLTGRAPRQAETGAMLRGTLLEPGLREWYAADRGLVVHRGPTLAEPGWYVSEHVHARTDAWSALISEPKAIIAEIKTAQSAEGWERGVPAWYLPQVLTQLASRHPHGLDIIGADVVFYAVGSKAPVVYHVEPDGPRQAALVAWLERWYERHILGDEPPDATNDAAKALLATFSRSTGEWVQPDPETIEIVEEYRRLKVAEKRIKRDLGTFTTHLGAIIGEADGIAGLLAWDRVRGRATLDTKRLAKDHPGLLDAYTKIGAPSRRFRDLSHTEQDEDGE